MADTATTPPVFAGTFRHTLDTKNRITIPSKWRASDSDEFFLVPDQTSTFLIAMPPGEFKAVGERVTARTDIPPALQRSFTREFYSQAQNCATDKQGRLLVTEEHRKAVGLDQEIVLLGCNERFEIWSRAKWQPTHESQKPTYREVADLIGL